MSLPELNLFSLRLSKVEEKRGKRAEKVGFTLIKSGDSFHKAATLSLQHHKINSAQIGREDGVH